MVPNTQLHRSHISASSGLTKKHNTYRVANMVVNKNGGSRQLAPVLPGMSNSPPAQFHKSPCLQRPGLLKVVLLLVASMGSKEETSSHWRLGREPESGTKRNQSQQPHRGKRSNFRKQTWTWQQLPLSSSSPSLMACTTDLEEETQG